MNRKYTRTLIILLSILLSLECFCQTKIDSTASEKDSSINKPDTIQIFPYVKIAADPRLKGNGFYRFMTGKNYRNEWTEPVRVPVLNLTKDYGGLTPKKEGGGKETKSLQVEDSSGKAWALRSIKKYPEKVVPDELKNTLGERLFISALSASYPYGALSMAELSKAAQVPYLKDTLVFLPDDTALGKFRDKFKNTMVLMEEKEPDLPLSQKESDEKEKTISTESLVYKLADNNKNKVDQLAVLKVRLLDNFVMDFDRHEGQWEWGKVKKGDSTIYYPVPKDRDQVFYTNQGFLPKIIRSKGLLPEIQGFKAKDENSKTFNRTAWNFDHYFLNELTRQEWENQVDTFLQAMTDPVIEAALQKQPQEIQMYSTAKIISTLKEKRMYFKSDMMRYYEFLSSKVAIVGSNNREQFLINGNDDKTVTVIVNKLDSAGNISSVLYERNFDPKVTKEINIYGLEGDDKFIVTGEKPKIKIRLIGGPGDDEFISKGEAKNVSAYDVLFEQNQISGKGIKNKFSWDPQTNTYQRLGYKTSLASPGISVDYSVDGGLYLGLKLNVTSQSFRKQPFASRQVFVVQHAINSASWYFRYNGEFTDIARNTDFLMIGDYKVPTSRTNFFGIGNNTVFDHSKPNGHEYYFARYDLANYFALFRKRFSQYVSFSLGPSFQYINLRKKENEGKYISYVLENSSDKDRAYEEKLYVGGDIRFNINKKDNPVFPEKGYVFNAYARPLFGINQYSNNVTQVGGDFTFFTDFISHNRVVLASSFGGGHNFGNYEFEQAQVLGYNENLRGFRLERYAGDTRAYNNTELRFRFPDVNLSLFKASVGFLVFNDVGRVWVKGEESNKWHDGYGGGLWLVPLNRLVVSGVISYSNEEKNFILVNFGFQF